MKLLSAFFILALLIASPVFADDIDVMDFEKSLRDMNRVKPLQDHRYHQLKDVLNRRILDKTNRVMGTVEDITFNMDGTVLSVNSLMGQSISMQAFLNVAKVTDILFDEPATRVHAIYVTVNHRTIRKKGVALPIDAFDFSEENGRIKIMVKAGLGDSLLEYVRYN